MDFTTTKELSNGVKIPMIGFGTWLIRDPQPIIWAIEEGYRHIDTAAIYENECEVGQAIKQSGVTREELFVTSKLWTEDMRASRQFEAFEESLAKLETDYIDLYLIHWPVMERLEETWDVLEAINKSGRAKAIGVSNFNEDQLDQLLKIANTPPVINQFEVHPRLSQKPLIDYCKKDNIAVEAYNPLGGVGSDLLESSILKELADKYAKTPAQIVLRWDLQQGIIVFPKSSNKERIIQNKDLYDFELTEEDMALIDSINKNERIGANPANHSW